MLQYSIDSDLGLIVVSASGVVTAADMHMLRQQVSKDPAFDPRFPALFDLTGATSLQFTREELRQLAAAKITHPSARRAFVVPNDVGFGLARMFQTFSEIGGHSENVQVFRTVAAARQWAFGTNASPVPKPGA